MIADLIIMLDSLRGKVAKGEWYFRRYRDRIIAQRCPRKWKDTPARKAAREKFIERYAQRQKTATLKDKRQKTKDKRQ